MASVYGFLQGAWPFGVVEAIWALIAARRWQKRRSRSRTLDSEDNVLRENINDGVKDAMKAQGRAATLDAAAGQCRDQERRHRGARRRQGALRRTAILLALMQKMIKQRQELVDLYEKGGRKELAEQERGEIAVIAGFLPQADVGRRDDCRDRGRDHRNRRRRREGHGQGDRRAARQYAGQMDFGKASGLVKAKLSGG